MVFGYKGPSYDALRVKLLADVKNEVKLLIDSYGRVWNDIGCTLVGGGGGGWTDGRLKNLINFLVYCPKGIAFIKSVDASAVMTDAQLLCNLFFEIVDMVGAQNIVHLVTDIGINFKADGRLLNEKYENICWYPCAAHSH